MLGSALIAVAAVLVLSDLGMLHERSRDRLEGDIQRSRIGHPTGRPTEPLVDDNAKRCRAMKW